MYTRTRIVRVLILSTVDPYKNLAYLRLSPPLASSLYPLWLGTKLGNLQLQLIKRVQNRDLLAVWMRIAAALNQRSLTP